MTSKHIPIFITGNEHKAVYLAKWLKMPLAHHKLDLDELQSLDLNTVVTHKVQQAYQKLQQPVLVEDVGLVFSGMGRLPGTFIKWFLEEIGNEGLCRLAASLPTKEATAQVMYGLYDGQKVTTFLGEMEGKIAPTPRGNLGFGWNPIFIPNGSDKTYAEMSDDELRPFSHRARAIEKLSAYLKNEEQP